MNNQLNFPVGISDFKKIRENDYYIDKSGLIKELLKRESAEVTLIQIFPRPTDAPAADRTNPIFPEKELLLFFSFSISLSVPIFHDYNQSELSLFLIRLYYQTLIILICQTIYFITFTQ